VQLEVVPGGADALAQRAAVWMADHIWAAIDERGVAHVAVSGGSSPVHMFRVLSGLPVPWGRVHVWQVDERVAPDRDPDRNLNDLRAALLDHVPVTAHLFDVNAADLADAAARYAAELRAACGGVFDVVHLGLGDDGHTASWPPSDRVVDVTDTDAAVSSEYKGRVRLTLTVPAVNRARHVMVLVAGADKANAVRALLEGDPGIPASHVRRAGTTVLADADAAGSP
jgi:6-phosphogluconolactonase